MAKIEFYLNAKENADIVETMIRWDHHLLDTEDSLLQEIASEVTTSLGIDKGVKTLKLVVESLTAAEVKDATWGTVWYEGRLGTVTSEEFFGVVKIVLDAIGCTYKVVDPKAQFTFEMPEASHYDFYRFWGEEMERLCEGVIDTPSFSIDSKNAIENLRKVYKNLYTGISWNSLRAACIMKVVEAHVGDWETACIKSAGVMDHYQVDVVDVERVADVATAIVKGFPDENLLARAIDNQLAMMGVWPETYGQAAAKAALVSIVENSTDTWKFVHRAQIATL